MSLSFCQRRRLVFDQSSPGHPVSESEGGPLSVTNGGWTISPFHWKRERIAKIAKLIREDDFVIRQKGLNTKFFHSFIGIKSM